MIACVWKPVYIGLLFPEQLFSQVASLAQRIGYGAVQCWSDWFSKYKTLRNACVGIVVNPYAAGG